MAKSGNQVSRRLSVGRAEQPDERLWDQMEAQVDAGRMQRKGRLLLLCSPGIDLAAVEAVYRGYYGAASHDVLPSLSATLVDCCEIYPGLVHSLPLVAVAFGLEVYLVGSRDAAAWMLHHGQVRGVLGVGAAESRAIPLGQGQSASAEEWRLWGAHQRLMVGDRLVLSTGKVSERISPEGIGALGRTRGAAHDLAAAVSRSAGRAGRQPALVVQAGGFSSVPGFGGAKKPAEPASQPAAPARRGAGDRSPIWTALLIAMAAVVLALWVRRPTIPKDDIREWVDLLLTPRPTAEIVAGENQAPTAQGPLVKPTPPLSIREATRVAAGGTEEPLETATPASTRVRRPTDTATPRVVAVPKLLSPVEGESVGKTYVTLEWEWDGKLGDDEYFDVRLWRLGAPMRGIAWTKQTRYVERSGQTGWHTWTVAIVRGREGIVLEEFVMAPEVDFRWVVKGGSQPRLSPAPPTRVAPDQPPTRTAP